MYWKLELASDTSSRIWILIWCYIDDLMWFICCFLVDIFVTWIDNMNAAVEYLCVSTYNGWPKKGIEKCFMNFFYKNSIDL